MNKLIYFLSSSLVMLLITSCFGNPENAVNLNDYIVEKEIIWNDNSELEIQNNSIQEFLSIISNDVIFTNVKVSSISFKHHRNQLIPVTSDSIDKQTTLKLFNIKGYSKSTNNDTIIGIFEWDNSPEVVGESVDKLKIKMDFEIAIDSLNSYIVYNTGKIERFQSFSLYNQGYIWDLYRTPAEHPVAAAVYIESTKTNVFKESRVEYHFTIGDNNSIVIENTY